jgi:hypothetical protein
MSEHNRARRLSELGALLEKPGGKQALRFAINAIGGAVPIAGGAIAGVGSFWAECEQSESSGKFLDWALLADAEIARLSESVARLLAEPSRASMSLLLGEILGDSITSQLIAPEGSQVEVVLNPSTVAELEPYLSKTWLTLRSTGAVCSMGANNRVGSHIEEMKRPYGLGSGFVLSVAAQGRNEAE